MSRIYGLIGTRLPVHPQPYPDELFSHWFFRLAHANHLKAQTLADYAFGRFSPFWARDQDKLAHPQLINRLAELTGLLPADIHALTLAAYEGRVYASHNPCGHTRWILPLGIYHRTWRLFGLQYCPLCLFEDAEPYFRRQWRLALSTVCEKHGLLMHDRCYKCGAPVMFFRNDLGHPARHNFNSSACCNNCGADLARAPGYDPPAPDGQTLAMLRSLGLAANLGWGWVGSEAMPYGHLFFDVLHGLATCLTSPRGRKLLSEVERQMGGMPLQGRNLSRGVFELRPFTERHWLLLSALWLLQEWPDRFVATCRATGAWKSVFLGKEALPWWFAKVLNESLDRSIYVPSAAEAFSAVEYLKQSGLPVTQSSVGRILGGHEHKVAQNYVLRAKSAWPKTSDEFSQVFAAIDEQTLSSEPGSPEWLIAERNRTIFSMMQVTGRHPACVLKMTLVEANAALKSKRLPRSSRLVLQRYLYLIRPVLVRDHQYPMLFVGYRKSEIGVANLAQTLRRLRRE